MTLELTYGLERIAMYLQGVESVYDLVWGGGQKGRDGAPAVRYGDIHVPTERQFSAYNFHHADVEHLRAHFETCEREAKRLVKLTSGADHGDEPLVFPAYDWVLKASHAFNLLDARGAIGVTERASYILRVRALASACARGYLKLRGATPVEGP